MREALFMKAKSGRRATLRPLAETIAADTRNKKALRKQFWSFYNKTKRTLKLHPELRHLEVPLEEIKDSVQRFAHGVEFGELLVELVVPSTWEE
jgi:hypothetical protein